MSPPPLIISPRISNTELKVGRFSQELSPFSPESPRNKVSFDVQTSNSGLKPIVSSHFASLNPTPNSSTPVMDIVQRIPLVTQDRAFL